MMAIIISGSHVSHAHYLYRPVIAHMITMYASVLEPTADIGTLRALGFQRASLYSFIIEALSWA